jgi:hypothetical protein
MISRVLREPLLHFVLIGLGLFLVHEQVAPSQDDSHLIVINRSQVADIARRHETTWNRPPTPAEMTALLEAQVRDEISYREGLALGLERDDPVIKRRIRQKLEVMLEENGARRAPTDADLRAYLSSHSDEFRTPAVVTFQQVFFPQGTDRNHEIAHALQRLQRGAAPASLSQPTLLPVSVDMAAIELVARDFGDRFAERLPSLAVGKWSGPIESAFGLHLVRVDAFRPSAIPPLAEVQRTVAREWEREQRATALDTSYERLRRTYTVRIEASPSDGPRP